MLAENCEFFLYTPRVLDVHAEAFRLKICKAGWDRETRKMLPGRRYLQPYRYNTRMWLTDRQTDRRTDGHQTTASTDAVRVASRRAVKPIYCSEFTFNTQTLQICAKADEPASPIMDRFGRSFQHNVKRLKSRSDYDTL